jgi:hypothetical protein
MEFSPYLPCINYYLINYVNPELLRMFLHLFIMCKHIYDPIKINYFIHQEALQKVSDQTTVNVRRHSGILNNIQQKK